MKLKHCIECGAALELGCAQKYCNELCKFRAESRKDDDDDVWVTPCVYCGVPADSIDHVPPRTARDRILEMGLASKYPFFTVEACRECNSLLGGQTFWTLDERKRYIKKTLRKRYKKYIELPDWSEEELKELGGSMSEYVNNSLEIKRVAIKRLEW